MEVVMLVVGKSGKKKKSPRAVFCVVLWSKHEQK